MSRCICILSTRELLALAILCSGKSRGIFLHPKVQTQGLFDNLLWDRSYLKVALGKL
jgi:hypothetical protein